MPTIKTYRKVGAFYIACEADFPTVISTIHAAPQAGPSYKSDSLGVVGSTETALSGFWRT
jgi:hypothetical protein